MSNTAEAENQRQQVQKEAAKFDGPKVPFDLVPYDALWEITRVFRYGKNKYEARNWELKTPFRRGRLFAACCRHMFAYWMGEDKDPESGYLHLAHAGCMLLMLLSYCLRGMGEDDRCCIDTGHLDSFTSEAEKKIIGEDT